MDQNKDLTAADFSQIEKRAQRNERIRKFLTYLLLGFWALIVLFPFYWMLLTSVKSYSAYNSEYVPQLYTLSPTLQNYFDAFTTVSLGRYFANTLFFSINDLKSFKVDFRVQSTIDICHTSTLDTWGSIVLHVGFWVWFNNIHWVSCGH